MLLSLARKPYTPHCPWDPGTSHVTFEERRCCRREWADSGAPVPLRCIQRDVWINARGHKGWTALRTRANWKFPRNLSRSVRLNAQKAARCLMLQGFRKRIRGMRESASLWTRARWPSAGRLTRSAAGRVTFVQNNQWPLCYIYAMGWGGEPGETASDLPLSTKSSKVTSAVVRRTVWGRPKVVWVFKQCI